MMFGDEIIDNPEKPYSKFRNEDYNLFINGDF